MHYVLADDSLPFDGFTASQRPLGGAEKALADLAAALVKQGHTATVLNGTQYPSTADGVRYQPLDEFHHRPVEADVLIAFRQPHLLGAVRKARHRLLWVVAAPDYLQAPANTPLWESFAPTILFVGAAQQRVYRGALPHRLLRPGVAAAFCQDEDLVESTVGPTDASGRVPPHAVVTTHPLHGLAWLTEIWRRLVHPQMPEARMMVYSTLMAKGLREDSVPDALQPVLDRVKAASGANVVVVDPRSDSGMADIYRASRVHLYPGHPHDFACWTLAESQASGTPAVARGVGGVEEHVINGQSGFIVPDAAAFANVTLEILRNDQVHRSLSTAAADVTRRRTWAMVAAELDAMIAGLPGGT